MHPNSEFRRRVLLVDRDEAFLRSCSVALRGEGYHVITAKDGFKALQALRGASPDALVSELNLPHMVVAVFPYAQDAFLVAGRDPAATRVGLHG